ncbi:hypothetical protein AVEN_117802-1 [Araneus ventricosus]|uniref:Uncharacterized protein n=1 Tax=Araneus ventricosus TaxID=182803 RepID=A0A4Y2B9Y0_ARAVE|nr:hypothetical protein AVEN_117802-1 [Araneus ventricosus]
MACPARSPESNRACVGHVGKTDCRSQCTSRHPPQAPTSLTTGMGITATTSYQRYYCLHSSPLSSVHFGWRVSYPLLACGSHCTFCLPIWAVELRQP